MRIIGGQAKGRRIVKPSGGKVRPTSDMVKEALFNLLMDVTGSRFLDLYAGTGSVGLEALSRGAVQVSFVERDPSGIEAIRTNAERCGFREGFECIPTTVERALKGFNRRGETFDVIFLDPPYGKEMVRETLLGIVQNALLGEKGRIVAQHSIREAVEGDIDHLVLEDERRYGDTLLTFWTKSS